MSKKNRNRTFVNVDELVVDGDKKVEINENSTLFTKVNTEPQKHETIITAPKEEIKEEIKPVFDPVVEKKEEPVKVEEATSEPMKEIKTLVIPKVENVEEQPKRRVVAVPCVTKNVKAADLIAQQHGYAVNINLPRI